MGCLVILVVHIDRVFQLDISSSCSLLKTLRCDGLPWLEDLANWDKRFHTLHHFYTHCVWKKCSKQRPPNRFQQDSPQNGFPRFCSRFLLLFLPNSSTFTAFLLFRQRKKLQDVMDYQRSCFTLQKNDEKFKTISDVHSNSMFFCKRVLGKIKSKQYSPVRQCSSLHFPLSL